MKFGKTLILGLALALAGPIALADTIVVTGTEGASGITDTGISFAANGTGANAGYSVGTVSSGTGAFSSFASHTAVYPLQTIGSNPAMKFDPSSTPAGPSVATPILFLTVSNGTNTIKIYLTSVTSHTKGSTTTAGTLSATGYLTENGVIVGNVPISLTLTNTANGNAAKSFTATATTTGTVNYVQVSSTPEPASLALLGTGLVSVVGAVRRRGAKA